MSGEPAPVTPGVVSSVVAPLVQGPRRRARVVGVTRLAVYVQLEGSGTLLAVVSAEAVRVPNALVIDRPITAAFPAAQPGIAATVGGGEVCLAGHRIVADRIWRPGLPRFARDGHALARAAELADLVERDAAALPAYLLAPVAEFAAALTTEPDRIEPAVLALLGLGPGLTPSGDDVIAGALVALRAVRGPGEAAARDLADRVAALVLAAAPRRTALVSAELLAHAAEGRCVPELAALLAALDCGAALGGPLRALLRVGHHSGGDLARGAARALQASAARADLHPVPAPLEEPWSICS